VGTIDFPKTTTGRGKGGGGTSALFLVKQGLALRRGGRTREVRKLVLEDRIVTILKITGKKADRFQKKEE